MTDDFIVNNHERLLNVIEALKDAYTLEAAAHVGGFTPDELRDLIASDAQVKRAIDLAVSEGQYRVEQAVHDMALSRPSVVTVFFAKAVTALTEKQSAFLFEKAHQTDDTTFANAPKLSDFADSDECKFYTKAVKSDERLKLGEDVVIDESDDEN